MTPLHSRKDSEAGKISEIAEILGLLDETHRGKDWILDQIKKSRVKVPFKHTMNSSDFSKSNIFINTFTFINFMYRNLLVRPAHFIHQSQTSNSYSVYRIISLEFCHIIDSNWNWIVFQCCQYIF